jgi:hypothetical protein
LVQKIGQVTTFAATDEGGKLVLTLIDVSFDKALFDAKGEIHLKYSSHELFPGDWATGGSGEIAREFMAHSSTRATEYMNWWVPQIAERRLRDFCRWRVVDEKRRWVRVFT